MTRTCSVCLRNLNSDFRGHPFVCQECANKRNGWEKWVGKGSEEAKTVPSHEFAGIGKTKIAEYARFLAADAKARGVRFVAMVYEDGQKVSIDSEKL